MNKTHLLNFMVILIIGIIVYANSFGNNFVWDDLTLIKENIYIKNWAYIPKIFTTDMGAGAGGVYHYYRPFQIFIYTLDYFFCKLNPAGYHLTNVLLHISAAVVVYCLILLIFNDVRLSFLASILFVTHPIQTEAVSYISGMGDPLSALFMLLCFIFYIKQLQRKNLGAYLLMLLSYALALLSKENAIILPALLLLYHYSFKEKIKIKQFASVLAPAVIYILLRVTVLRSSLPAELHFTDLFRRIPGFFAAITDYTRLLLAPFSLHMEYGNGLFNLAHPKAIAGILIVSLLPAYAFRKKKADKLFFFCISWFFIALLPVTNIYPPLPFYMTEHYLYLPSIGFFIILARGLISLYSVKRLKWLGIFLTGSLLIFYSGMTINQNNYWKNLLTFYEKTLKYAPDNVKVNSDLGNLYNDTGRYKEAINLLEKAIQLDPTYANSYNNLGNSYYAIGNIKEAISLYNKSLRLKPHANTYNNLANAYAATGDVDKAISILKKAIEFNPEYPRSYYDMGVIYLGMGKNKEAVDLFGKSIKLEPNFSESYVNLAVIHYNTGKLNEAIPLLKRAIEINPAYGKAYFNLSVIYFIQKQYDLSVEYCDKAIECSYKKIPPEFSEHLRPYRKK